MKPLLHALLLAGFAAAASAGTIRNPSFEEPADTNRADCAQAADWETSGTWWRRETGWQPRHWGPCMMAYHHWRVTEPAPSGFHQDVSGIPPNTSVRFSIFVSSDADANFQTLEIRIEPQGGGAPLAAQVLTTKSLKDTDWRQVSVATITPPSGAIRVAVLVSPAAGHPRRGAIRFDDASLDIGGSR